MPKKSRHQKMLASKRRTLEPAPLLRSAEVINQVPQTTSGIRTYSVAGASPAHKSTPYTETGYLKSDIAKIMLFSLLALAFEVGLRYAVHVNPLLLKNLPFLSSLTF